MPHASALEKLKDTESLLLNLRDLGRMGVGIMQALHHLRSFKPDVVFAKGGFVALPVAVAARILGIPVVAHESDVSPGIGSKVVSRWARKMAVGFPAELYGTTLGESVVFTGNPIRQEILGGNSKTSVAHFFGKVGATKTAALPVVLIMGGSSGARTINQAVIAGLADLVKVARVIHIVGLHDYAAATQHAAELKLKPSQYRAFEFLQAAEMKRAYAAATVVVSRAGANTITELAAMKLPTILIPNHLMAAHQLVNAKRLAQADAIQLLAEEELNPQSLITSISDLLNDSARQKVLTANLHPVYVPDAADRIAKLLLEAAV